MRLLTHNQLMCIRKGCPKQYPLTLNATSVEQEETQCNAALVAHLMCSLDYSVLYSQCVKFGIAAGLPEPDQLKVDWMKVALVHSKRLEEADSDDEEQANNEQKEMEVDDQSELLELLHTVLMDTHVQEGELVCDGCKRQYSIQQGIPNMRLNEDEV